MMCSKFFLELDRKRRLIDIINKLKGMIREHQESSLLADNQLKTDWVCVFGNQFSSEAAEATFVDIVHRFLQVANNQYKNTLLEKLSRKKRKLPEQK